MSTEHDELIELIDARITATANMRATLVKLDAAQLKTLLDTIADLGAAKPPPAKAHLTFSITTPCGVIITGVPPLMLTLKDNQSVVYTIGAKDSAGNPATIAGPVTAAVSDPTVLSAVLNPDGTITVKALGPLSTPAGVQLTVDDTGDGGLTGTDTLVVVASAPTALVLTAGAPTP